MDAVSAHRIDDINSTDPKESPSVGRKITKMMSDLSKKMSRRLTPEEMSQKNLLPEEVSNQKISSNIIQAKNSLELEKAKNSLSRRISLRPTKDDLKLRNILKEGSSEIHLSEQRSDEPQKKFQEKKTQLKSILKKRPEKSLLQEMNILKYGASNMSLAEAQEREKKENIQNTLENHLLERPSMATLKSSKFLFFSDEIEVGSTYKKTEYNRRPDEDSTFRKLTPQLKTQIREELNQFKKTEMEVHKDSITNTCFH